MAAFILQVLVGALLFAGSEFIQVGLQLTKSNTRNGKTQKSLETFVKGIVLLIELHKSLGSPEIGVLVTPEWC